MSDGTFVYDDDCGFCTWWAEFFAARTDLRTVGFESLTDEQLELLPDDYENCSHLITDEEVYSCGASIEAALVRADLPPGFGDLSGFLRQFDDYERLRERAYRTVADRRDVFGMLVSSDPPARSDGD